MTTLSPEEIQSLTREGKSLKLTHNNIVGRDNCVQVNFVNVDTKEESQLGPLCSPDITPPCVV